MIEETIFPPREVVVSRYPAYQLDQSRPAIMWELILNLVYDHFHAKYLAAIEASASLFCRPFFLNR
jgi:hypothetical protein